MRDGRRLAALRVRSSVAPGARGGPIAAFGRRVAEEAGQEVGVARPGGPAGLLLAFLAQPGLARLLLPDILLVLALALVLLAAPLLLARLAEPGLTRVFVVSVERVSEPAEHFLRPGPEGPAHSEPEPMLS